MSGTSLDGLDLAACTFRHDKTWNYSIDYCKTAGYSRELVSALQCLDTSTALKYAQTDHDLGRLFGTEVIRFISETGFKPNYISSHGHTVFHQPKKHLTTQIGHPAAIAALTKTPTIADFRTADVHLNGQGAPLVPIGDLLLFSEYEYCLNLGGIANISIKTQEDSIQAYDICIANMALNYVAQKVGKSYDAEGELASSGTIDTNLLEALNQLPYLSLSAPKSIGKEWFDSEIKPLIEHHLAFSSTEDVLATLCEHIALQVSAQLPVYGRLLVTGGGAKNDFLMNCLKARCNAQLILPETELIDYKEALIFAFLGALHVLGEDNILTAVTGSSSNHVGGCIYRPFGMGKN